MSDRHYDRATLLMEQSRHDLAEKELHLALASNPNDGSSHALLSLCLTAQGSFRQGERAAREAIGLAPDLADGHYALACALRQRNLLAPAASAMREALRLRPNCASYLGSLAEIRLNQQRWSEALTIAEQGLSAEPDHRVCASIRAMALSYLGRPEEAEGSLVESLGRDPSCGMTHANRGLALLRQGRSREALDVLREAVRLQPQDDQTRHLYRYALKAQWPIARFAFAYQDWQVRHPDLTWLMAILVLWAPLATWVLPELAPASATFWGLVIVFYVLAVVAFWVADPATDVVLRFDGEGRHALTRAERVAGTIVSLCVAIAIGLAAVGFATAAYSLVESSVVLLLVCLPLSSMRSFKSARARWVFGTIALGLFVAALVPVLRFGRNRSEVEMAIAAFLPLTAFMMHISALVVVAASDRATPRRNLA
jgi:Flp pilus assembly protein TadD